MYKSSLLSHNGPCSTPHTFPNLSSLSSLLVIKSINPAIARLLRWVFAVRSTLCISFYVCFHLSFLAQNFVSRCSAARCSRSYFTCFFTSCFYLLCMFKYHTPWSGKFCCAIRPFKSFLLLPTPQTRLCSKFSTVEPDFPWRVLLSCMYY